jgi:hypothetical protein
LDFIGCFHSMSFLVHVLSSLAILDLLPTGHILKSSCKQVNGIKIFLGFFYQSCKYFGVEPGVQCCT